MSDLNSPVDWFVHRRAVRTKRNALRLSHRRYLDRNVASIFKEARDENEFKQFIEAKVNADSIEMGFDPATVLLLLQLAALIYQLLKHFEVVSPSPETVGLFAGDE